jgi:hypothetical protein
MYASPSQNSQRSRMRTLIMFLTFFLGNKKPASKEMG